MLFNGQETSRSQANQTMRNVYAYTVSSESDTWGMNIDKWDWTPGVGVIAVLHYYEATGDAGALEYLDNWVERNKALAVEAKVINSMAPYAVFPELYRRTNKTYYRDEAVAIGDWMLHSAPRTREGAFEHTVTEQASFPEQVWADTIFMAVLLLARLAELTGREDYAKEALRQMDIHFSLLQHEDSGVWYHGWNCLEGNHMSAAKWTRANAWIVIGFPLIVKELRRVIDVPDGLIERYRAMVDGLLRYRSSDGLWHTVMNRPDFYKETSASAGIAAGIMCSVRTGLLKPSYLIEAFSTCSAVIGQIDEAGEVQGVSGGTPVMNTIEDYNRIPQIPTLYGQGLTLMMLAEIAFTEAEGERL